MFRSITARAVAICLLLLASGAAMPAAEPLPVAPVRDPGRALVVLDEMGNERGVDLPAALLEIETADGTIGRLLVPPSVTAAIDDALLDPLTLLREGGIAGDGTVGVVVDTRAPLAALPLESARALPTLGLVHGRLPYGELVALASVPGVARVWMEPQARVLLEESVPLIRADEVHAMRDALLQPALGTGVTIAIIDTGVDWTHDDLGRCLGSPCKVVGGHDHVDGDEEPMDLHGHGTHVAAIAAGVRGVAPGASILAHRVCDADGYCDGGHVLDAIEASVQAGVEVISISLGSYGGSDDPLSVAVDRAVEQGVVVVSAAGNDGEHSNGVGQPAASVRGIAVGASTKGDALAWFSSAGPSRDSARRVVAIKPDVVAPGELIRAAVPRGDCALCSASGERHLSGTSMAAPHVAGAAALLLQMRPDWSPDHVKGALVASAVDLGLPALLQGGGRIDARGALDASAAYAPALPFLGRVVSQPGPIEATMELGVIDLRPPLLPIGVPHPLLRGPPQAIALSASADAFALDVFPPVVETAPGAIAQATLTATLDGDATPDAWHEGAALAQTAQGNATHPLALHKTSVLRIHVEPAPWQIVVLREGRFHFAELRLGSHVEIDAPAGTYDVFSIDDACWTGEPCTPRIRGVTDVVVEHTTDVTLPALDELHTLTLRASLESGEEVDPAALPQCTITTSPAARCANLGITRVRREGTGDRATYGFSVYARHPTGHAQYSTMGPEWTVALHTQLRDGATLYELGANAQGVTADATLEPATAKPFTLRYPARAAGTGILVQYCWTEYGGFASGVPWPIDLGDATATRVVDRVPSFDGDPEAQPGCTSYGPKLWGDAFHDPARCTVGVAYDGCAVIGAAPWVRAGSAGAGRRWLDATGLGPDVLLFDGAPGLVGWVRPIGWEVEVVPAGGITWDVLSRQTWWHNTFFAPGSGGDQLLHQMMDNRQRVRIVAGEDVIADGPIVGWSNYLLRSVEEGTPISVTLSTDATLLGDELGAASHTTVYHDVEHYGTLPSIQLARVLRDGTLGTKFAQGDTLELVYRLGYNTYGSRAVMEALATSVTMRCDGIDVPVDTPTRDGDLYRVPLPSEVAGACDLVIDATMPDDVTLQLRQEPAFEVG